MTLPKLWRRTNADGEEIGAYHVTIKKRRINLRTQDGDKAKKRRLQAVSGRRTFEDDSQGTARINAALDAAPGMTPPGVVEGAVRTDDSPPAAPSGAPPPLALLPPIPEPEVVDAEPIPSPPAGSWTDDVAGGAAPSTGAADSPPPVGSNVNVSDIIPDSAFVAVSRIAVQLQMIGQSVIARKLFKFDLPVLADPPPKDLPDFMKRQGERWPQTDPREPGRAMWEKVARRICPTELPIPDYVAAPLLVAAGTLPVQFMNGSRIDPSAPPQQPAPQSQGAPPSDGV